MLANSGEITPTLRGARDRPLQHPLDHYSCLQPQSQQLEHPPIRDPPADFSQQSVVVDLAEEIGDVELDHELVTLDEPGPQAFLGHRRRPLRPKPIRAGQKVRLENRFQHDLGRRLGHPVPHRGNPQRPRTALWFRNLHPTRRRRAIPTRAEVMAQLTQHAVHAIVLHRDQGDPIHPGRTPVFAHPLPRLPQDVIPADTVEKGVETPTLQTAWPKPIAPVAVVALSPARPPTARRLRQAVARRGGWTGQTRSCPRAYPLRARDQSRGPSLPGVSLTPISGTMTPRIPLPSKGFHHRLIPLVFARRRPGRRASPVPDWTMCTCRSPYPGRTGRADPDQGSTDMGLRRDMSGSAPSLYL